MLVGWPNIRCGCGGKMIITEIVPDADHFKAAGQTIADEIDKEILDDIKAAGERLDQEEVPDTFRCCGGCQDCDDPRQCHEPDPDATVQEYEYKPVSTFMVEIWNQYLKDQLDAEMCDQHLLHKVATPAERKNNEIYAHLVRTILKEGIIEFTAGTLVRCTVIKDES
jgi:hypothetical protein